MNEFITRFLAELLEKFKLQNPKVYAIVVVVLMVGIYFAQQGSFLGLFTLSPVVASVIEWVSIILTGLFSSSTFGFLSASSQAKRPTLPQ